MNALPDAGRPLIDALIGAPRGWQTPHDIARATDADLEQTLDILCDLDVAGWIDVWDSAGGPLIAPSTRLARQLNLELNPRALHDEPRWVRRLP